MAETPPPPSPTAANTVFSTTELLENVLTFVDIKTLLLAQRVSKTFLSTITNSLALQQKLYFKRARPGEQALVNVEDVNPLLIPYLLLDEHDIWDATSGRLERGGQPPVFLYVDKPGFDGELDSVLWRGERARCDIVMREGIGAGSTEPSWRKMYVFSRLLGTLTVMVQFETAMKTALGQIIDSHQLLCLDIAADFVSGDLADKAFEAAKATGHLKGWTSN